jgi:drug/metabolite transporter (DMT)-like permease
MLKDRSEHLRVGLEALFVTFLWSTSWVLIKIGLKDIPPITFAGLRYSLAFCFLLPLFIRAGEIRSLRRVSGRTRIQLLTLGVLFYAVTQGAQFLGLAYLPAVTVNLVLSLTVPMVAALGVIWLAEWPTPLQWGGVGVAAAGAFVYFYPVSVPAGGIVGLVVVGIGLIANACSSILGRAVNRRGDLSPLAVTVISMGVGGCLLLISGGVTQGFPKIDPGGWGIILWLAVVNTAFAFTLWNHTLRTLSAMESSIINNTMMIQIPVLAVLFLQERLVIKEILGLVVVGAGVLLVQLSRGRKRPKTGGGAGG